MADPQTVDQNPSGSLPASLINPDDMKYFHLDTAAPKSASLSSPQPSLVQGGFLTSRPTLAPSPAPQSAAPDPTPPAPAPAVAPPTHLVTPPPAAPQHPASAQPSGQQPGTTAQPTTWRAVGDSIARGYQKYGGASGTGVDLDATNTTADAAGGRPPSVILNHLKSLPDGAFNGQNIIFSTGVSNNPGEINLVPAQLAELKRLGAANVKVVGVGSQAGSEGGHYYNLGQYNAQLQQDASAAGMTFSGGLPAVVHPAKEYYEQQRGQGPAPGTPGTGKTIDDVTAYIEKSEGGGNFILYGHEGRPYDPNTMPTKPGYYGFPDWAGGYGSAGQTHAAGGAQWEPDTWKRAVEAYVQTAKPDHTPDFRNPADQKAVFNYWADRRYRELTGRDIVADMNAGHVDWAALGPEWESLKYGGGGGHGNTASNLPGYQEWRRSIEGQRRTLDEESADLQRRMKDLEAGDPQQRALADQLIRKQMQLMDKYETLVDHPPTQKPHDMIGNFGSIATLIGIFAGRFAHRPMVASLNAAGAAMQAMNDNDYEAYQNAFKTWKTQTDMTSNLIGMESSTYKNIMEDRRLTMDEKFKEMDAAAKIYQNRLLSQQLEAGEYEKAWEYAQKLEKTKDDHDLAVQQLEEQHQKQEAWQQTQAQIQRDNADWDAANPNATESQKQAAHYQNYMTRMREFNTLTSPLGKSAAGMVELEKEQAVKSLDDEFATAFPNATADEKAKAHLENRLAVEKQFKTAQTADKPLSLQQVKAQAIQEAVKTADDDFAQKNPNATPQEKRRAHDENFKKALIETTLEGSAPRGSVPTMLAQQYKMEHPNAPYEEVRGVVEENIRRQAIERSYAGGPTQRNVISLNTAAGHIERLRAYAEALDTGDMQKANAMAQWIERETGGQNITNFEIAKNITADEVVRLLTSTGGTEADRKNMQDNIAARFSPAQMGTAHDVATGHGALGVLEEFVGERFKALEQGYAQNDPEKAKRFHDEFLMPEAQTMFDRATAASTPKPPPTPTPTTAKPGWVDPGYTDPPHKYKGPDGVERDVWPQGGKWYFGDHTAVPGQ